ncbi:chemotaxis protein CheB [Bdellovibrio bacteriovorus]|uniref:Probable chemoreceptor glutamine deamidase CheD n=1 Tax=Bdellovibrio bacteriovorus TaxID=959 RepID=A0A150WSF0_BDEBC|nr:chemotaxis protein CheB [Bdellovibrio bacteriovorus]KYG67199.1 chemotaxis protein CheB [Bdellovibrio bacteriovorus]
MNTHYLFPGKLAAFKEETVISTLLGSCVAVALHDPTAKVGGLNHYLLPEGAPDERENARYGICAIPQLIEECVRLGAQRSRLQAKIYGGGNVISVSGLGDGIGKRNIDLAEQLLREFNIPIIERNVAGESARTIKLNTANFNVIHNQSGTSSADKPVDVSGFKPLSIAKNVKVLVVDDSATVRTLFTSIFTKSGLEVVGAAADAYQARELILSKKPDVMTLDIEMPKMSGVMFLEKLMKHHPIPVVMVSSLASTGEAALKSLDLGAIEFVHKPSQFDPAVLKDLAGMLVEKVKAAASVNIVKKLKEAPAIIETRTTTVSSTLKRAAELKVIVVGGNAGSADALEKFVKGLAADTPPVVVSCSTVANFVQAYISKIKVGSKVTPVVAKDGEFLKMGHVYFIPAEHHGKVLTGGHGPMLQVQKGAPVASQLPSSNVLFQSAAQSYSRGVYAVLLGGFGSDGVEGLIEVQKKGGASVVQHPEEAQFPYGPQKAIELGVADEILKADSLAGHLMQYRNQNLY